jgi:hypothetical protein
VLTPGVSKLGGRAAEIDMPRILGVLEDSHRPLEMGRASATVCEEENQAYVMSRLFFKPSMNPLTTSKYVND